MDRRNDESRSLICFALVQVARESYKEVSTNEPFRKRHCNTPETIYTKLRNQIGHDRPSTTFKDTRRDMEIHRDGLVKLVKKSIYQHLRN